MNDIFFYYQTAIGALKIETKDNFLLKLSFVGDKQSKTNHNSDLTSFQKGIKGQLNDYFKGKLAHFDIPLLLEGTSFEKETWQYLLKIPLGQVTTYGEIAGYLGNSNKTRAVGRAVGKNPIAIIVPCHRVIGSNGNLTGYAGGLWRKEWLLKHEGALLV